MVNQGDRYSDGGFLATVGAAGAAMTAMGYSNNENSLKVGGLVAIGLVSVVTLCSSAIGGKIHRGYQSFREGCVRRRKFREYGRNLERKYFSGCESLVA